MNCSACGNRGLRKTVLAMVLTGGEMKRARVCVRCANGGVLIVAKAASLALDEMARRAAAGDHKEQREVLAPFVKRCEALATAARTAFENCAAAGEGNSADAWSAKLEAYEAIAHMLKEGRT